MSRQRLALETVYIFKHYNDKTVKSICLTYAHSKYSIVYKIDSHRKVAFTIKGVPYGIPPISRRHLIQRYKCGFKFFPFRCNGVVTGTGTRG